MSEVLIVILTSSVITATINIMWKYYESKSSFRNKKYMQITNYYRELSGKDMHLILGKWTEMLFQLTKPDVKKKMQDETYLNQLLNDTYLYSSPETCTRLANFQQYNYKKVEGKKDDNFVIIILVASIIVSLKHDFTGEWVSIQETLKVKLTDFYKNEDKILKVIKEYGYDNF